MRLRENQLQKLHDRIQASDTAEKLREMCFELFRLLLRFHKALPATEVHLLGCPCVRCEQLDAAYPERIAVERLTMAIAWCTHHGIGATAVTYVMGQEFTPMMLVHPWSWETLTDTAGINAAKLTELQLGAGQPVPTFTQNGVVYARAVEVTW